MDPKTLPTPSDRREPLERWFESKLSDARDVRIESIDRSSGAGFVNETLLIDLHWTDGTSEHHAGYVVRSQPSEFMLLYQADTFFKPQYELMRTLGEETDVPVPQTFWYEEDPAWLGQPFFAMEKVAGQTVPDAPPYYVSGWLHDATPAQQERLWWSTVETLAKIHTVDWQKAGLSFLGDATGGAGLDRRLDHYLAAYDWARDGIENPVVDAARQWLLENLPQNEPVALCWGDARLGNVVYQDFEATAVLDWEMASLGPPLQDLGWWFFMHRTFFGDSHSGDPKAEVGLPGFPAKEATIARWVELTGYSGRSYQFHEVFAGYRMAVHVQRMGTVFREFGLVPPESNWASNNLATQALAPMIGIEHPDPEPLPAIFRGG